MAKVLYSYLCWGLKKDKHTGKYYPLRTIQSFERTASPVLFTFVVYWTGKVGECFSQSFALVDDAGNILDEMPKMECLIGSEPEAIGTAYFCAVFSRPGCYSINVYQNGNCIESIPVRVIDPARLTIQ